MKKFIRLACLSYALTACTPPPLQNRLAPIVPVDSGSSSAQQPSTLEAAQQIPANATATIPESVANPIGLDMACATL